MKPLGIDDVRRRLKLKPFYGFQEKARNRHIKRIANRMTGRTTRSICLALAEASLGKKVVLLIPHTKSYARSIKVHLDFLAAKGGLSELAKRVTVRSIVIPKGFDATVLDHLLP